MTRLTIPRVPHGIVFGLAAIICTHKGFYGNVYSWGVAYVNYVLPVIGFVGILSLLEKQIHSIPEKILLFFTAFVSQLFMEPVTISMSLFAVYVLLCRRYRSSRVIAAAGIWLGALTMALNSQYRYVSSGESIHSVDLSFAVILKNLEAISYDAFLRNVPIVLLISWFFYRNLKAEAGGRNVPGVISFIMAAVCELTAVFNHALGVFPELFAVFCLGIIGLTWLVNCIKLKDGKCKERLFLFLGMSIISVAPLAAVGSGLSDRMYYECYIMLCLALFTLVPERVACKKRWKALAAGVSCAWLAFMIVIYSCNHFVNAQRIKLGQEQIEAGATQITLPLVPFADYCTNEHQGKGDLAFVLYNSEPFDVTLHFVSWEEYTLLFY